MEQGAAEGAVEAGLLSTDMETGERACRSRHVRNSCLGPHWHTLLFEGQVAVDMRVVCPQEVKKMGSQAPV